MENFPSTARFLNRLLALPIDQQNDLYEAFAKILKDHTAILGAKLEGKAIAKFQKSMGLAIEQPKPEEVFAGLLAGESYELSNELRLKQSRVMHQNRIEVITQGGATMLDKLTALGCISEIINYQRRVFIPTSNAGKNVLERVLAEFPVV